MRADMDHPKVRASHSCPVCNREKEQALLVCWLCYRALNLRNGAADFVVKLLDIAEERLPDNRR
jgi:hypothetical protein